MDYNINNNPPTMSAIKADMLPKRFTQVVLSLATGVVSFAAMLAGGEAPAWLMAVLAALIVCLIGHSLYYLGQNPSEISPAQCEEVILWRGSSPLIDVYVKKVAEQKRELIHPEYCMLLKQHTMKKHISAKSRLYES